MPLFFLGTREWRNRQTRTVQVRVPVMEWGFNSPLAHDETADPSGSAVFVFPGCCLRPHGCSGRRVCFVRPGCLLGLAAVCAGGRRPAREIATRELRSEWSISRPALALPPPTGAAAASTPAGLAPPSSRAASYPPALPPPTGTAATSTPAGLAPPSKRTGKGAFAPYEAFHRRVAGVSES